MFQLKHWRRWGLASLLVGGLGNAALGQTPTPTSPKNEPEIEVYVGTVKVAPIPPPPAPVMIIQEAPKPEPKPEPKEEPKPRVEAPVFVPIVPAGAWSPMLGPQPLPGSITSKSESLTPQGNTVFHLLGHVMTRLVLGGLPKADATQPVNTPHVVIIREPAPTVNPMPMASTPMPSQPQIVVMREPAPAPVPTLPEPARGLHLSWEMVGMVGFATVGVLCVVFLLGRSNKGQVVVQTAPALAMGPPPDYDPAKHGPLLSGKYVAGPMPETAERFDIGPSYHEEQKAKERAAEAGKQAVVANILMQNLELFDVEEQDAK